MYCHSAQWYAKAYNERHYSVLQFCALHAWVPCWSSSAVTVLMASYQGCVHSVQAQEVLSILRCPAAGDHITSLITCHSMAAPNSVGVHIYRWCLVIPLRKCLLCKPELMLRLSKTLLRHARPTPCAYPRYSSAHIARGIVSLYHD